MESNDKFIDLNIRFNNDYGQLFQYEDVAFLAGASNYDTIIFEELEGLLQINRIYCIIDGVGSHKELEFYKNNNIWCCNVIKENYDTYNIRIFFCIDKNEYNLYNSKLVKLKQNFKNDITDLYINITQIDNYPTNNEYFEYKNSIISCESQKHIVKLNTNKDIQNLLVRTITKTPNVRFEYIDFDQKLLIFSVDENESIYPNFNEFELELDETVYSLSITQKGKEVILKPILDDKHNTILNIDSKEKILNFRLDSNIDKLLLSYNYENICIFDKIEIFTNYKLKKTIYDFSEPTLLSFENSNYIMDIKVYVNEYTYNSNNEILNIITISPTRMGLVPNIKFNINQSPEYFIDVENNYFECEQQEQIIEIIGKTNVKQLAFDIKDDLIPISNVEFFINNEQIPIVIKNDSYCNKEELNGINDFKIKLTIKYKDFYGYIQKNFNLFDYNNKDINNIISIKKFGKDIKEFIAMFGYIQLTIHNIKCNYEEHEYELTVLSEYAWEVKLIN